MAPFIYLQLSCRQHLILLAPQPRDVPRPRLDCKPVYFPPDPDTLDDIVTPNMCEYQFIIPYHSLWNLRNLHSNSSFSKRVLALNQKLTVNPIIVISVNQQMGRGLLRKHNTPLHLWTLFPSQFLPILSLARFSPLYLAIELSPPVHLRHSTAENRQPRSRIAAYSTLISYVLMHF